MSPTRRDFLKTVAAASAGTALAPLASWSAPLAAATGVVRGVVFEDADGSGVRRPGARGIPGVKVSNGLDVVVTDREGRYELPVYPDMNLTVVQPAGWRVPVDARQVPQFFYVHKEAGSPVPLRFGGLPPTGPMPATVDFPLRRAEDGDRFRLAVLGDTQTYAHNELHHFRDSAVADLVAEGPGAYAGLLYVGDVVGDDLDLLPRLLEIGAAAGAPQWLVLGNHDIDFDAPAPEHAADSWRRIYGPDYYAFEIGRALFVVLNNVVYPCDAGEQAFCGERVTYNGRVPERQVRWLANLLRHTPPDRLVVLAHHIPLVSFVDAASAQHQTDNATELYRLLEGRPALSLSGHTHTIENHAPGQLFEGWTEAVGVGPLPFRHIIAGAVSGAWWQGDLGVDGTPMALQRMGAPKGFLTLDVDGTEYREAYVGAGLGRERAMWISLNTPPFRAWFEEVVAWAREAPAGRDPVPPASINDLPSTRLLTREDLAGGTWLVANVWAGSAETTVTASLDGEPARPMERSQQGAGEAARIGAEWADPHAAQRQLSVARFALQSRSGEPRNQGYEAFRGRAFGPAPPQPQTSIADRNMHLWRLRLPADLSEGVHTVVVAATDRHGRTFTEHLTFEVYAERPPAHWRREPWS